MSRALLNWVPAASGFRQPQRDRHDRISGSCGITTVSEERNLNQIVREHELGDNGLPASFAECVKNPRNADEDHQPVADSHLPIDLQRQRFQSRPDDVAQAGLPHDSRGLG